MSPMGLACLDNPRYESADHLDYLDEVLVALAMREIRRAMVFMPPRHGKLVAHETPVATPKGFVRHGALTVGDEVFAPDGRAIKVKALGEDDHASLRVTFSDGEQLDVHPNHEWKVYDRSTSGYRVMETREIARRSLQSGKRSVIQVDWTEPLDPEDKNLPVDPYALGVWLGDGSAGKACVTRHPDDMLDIGYEPSVAFTHKDTGIITTYYRGGLRSGLKTLGVLFDKHVPDAYLWAGRRQRWALLEGLIDTDGSVGSDGRVRFVNANPKLIAAVEHLARSFGYRTCVTSQLPCESSSGIVGKQVVFTVGFSPHDGNIPARLERKRNKATGGCQRRRRGIVSVEEIEPVLGRCIQVDSDEGMYLVGRHMVPTHNSELSTHYFPAWFKGRFPDEDVIISSHTASLAAEFGGKARDTLEAFGPEVFGVSVSQVSSAKNLWRIQGRQGRLLALGVGGSPIGRGAHALIIDDPYASREDAMSALVREKTWEWWRGTMRNRLEPGAIVLIIMQRWHEKDLPGMILEHAKTTGEHWEVVEFPAIAEEGDKLQRPLGAPLWPARYDLDELAAIRADVGEIYWSAQYQQHPTPATGDVFKREWFREFEDLDGLFVLRDGEQERFANAGEGTRFLTADFATSLKQTADWTVFMAWHYSPKKGDLLLLDVLRVRMEAPDHVSTLSNFRQKWGATMIGVEDPDQSVEQSARRSGLPVVKVPLKGDKRARAIPAAARMEGGGFWFRKGAHWLSGLEEELLRFTGSDADTDDQVDNISQAEHIRQTRLARAKLVGSHRGY